MTINKNCSIKRLSDTEAKVVLFGDTDHTEIHLVAGNTYKVNGNKKHNGRVCTLKKITTDLSAFVIMQDSDRSACVNCDELIPV